MKKIFKETLISIRKTKKRFISILLIVLLGVGFFAGIKATSPDMKDTLDDYYVKNNFMDFNLKFTWGITHDEINEIKDKGYKVESGYSIDAIVKDETDKVAKIMSYNEKNKINKLILIDGRLPKKNDECVIEYSKYKKHVKIGDTVKIISDDLDVKEFKVVGLVKSPIYISIEKGSTNLLSGTIDYFMYILEDNFNMEYFTDAYIKLNNDYSTFDKKYDELIEDETDKLELITTDLKNKRYTKVIEDAQEEIDKAKDEYNKYKDKVEPFLDNPYVPEQDKKEIKDKLKEAEDKIKTSEKDLEDLEEPEWYVLDRESNIGFFQYKQDTDRIKNIASVFPLVFFVVAVLVCLTSMTRMVEEERVQLGTLKSLGYSNFQIVSKYVFYAFLATLIGSIIGVCIGFRVLPDVIFNMYSTVYNIGRINTNFNVYYAILGTTIAILCTVLASVYTSHKELKEVPAELMRPKSPKPGKKVFLEHIPFIWKRLKFSKKVTVRNVFRYKKRFLMTIIGILGCTALILAGFGLKDCIASIVPNQYEDIFRYQLQVNLDKELDKEKLDNIVKELDKIKEVNDYKRIHKETVDISDHDTKEIVQLVVPIDSLDDYIILRNRKTKEELNLNNGVVVSEKISRLLDLKESDKITLKGDKTYKVKINGITENYLNHYIYMNKEIYNSDVFNCLLIKTDKMTEKEEKDLSKKIQEIDGVASIEFLSSTKNIFDDAMDNFSFISLVLVISAGLLAFVVLYNLSTVNISERKRELATIKVLGFYDKEVYNYINRETKILTFIGIILGLFFGVILTKFIIKTCEVDMMMFAPVITLKSYIYSVVITLLFAAVVNVVVYFSLKKIDMIDSLKSVE